MVIVGPFAQQLLTYYSYEVPLSDVKASIPRNTNFASLGPLSHHIAASISSMPPTWQQSINAGLFAPGQKVSVDCPSGNCTFPESYATVGYCSECTDVSDLLSIENQTFYSVIEGKTYERWGYNTSIPSGASCISLAAETGWWNWSSMSVNEQAEVGTSVDIILGQVPYDEFRQSFVDNNSTCIAQEGNTSWRCRGYGAASCTLYPCVKMYSGNVSLGSLEETVLDTSPPDQWSEVALYGLKATLDLQCVSKRIVRLF